MATMSPLDAMFLMMEAREKPAHVGGLQLFEPPADAGPDFLASLYEGAVEQPGELRRLFSQRPHRAGGLGPWAWQPDEKLDIEYHVRHSALPAPGRIRELLALVSRLHGSLLDRNRPLWEAHLIEGLADGRFALYSKVHHAVVDGVAAMRLLITSLSTDPDEVDMPYPWERRSPGGTSHPRAPTGPVDRVEALARTASEVPGMVAGAGLRALQSLVAGFSEQSAAMPYQAPRTMLNVPVTGARRFAAQSWDLARVHQVGRAYGATVNDVVLAMSAGALRAYLQEQDALPDQPLIAMVPVSLKAVSRGDDQGGNAVGALLCNLGTHVADPVARLELIQSSMRRGKAQYEGLTPTQVLLLSALSLTPGALKIGMGRVDLFGHLLPPGFNVVISNVPGSRDPLYWNGARMTGSYPVSVLVDGQAMNITVTSYDGSLDFGIIGCRRNVPHLQRMLGHLEDELAGLEARAA